MEVESESPTFERRKLTGDNFIILFRNENALNQTCVFEIIFFEYRYVSFCSDFFITGSKLLFDHF